MTKVTPETNLVNVSRHNTIQKHLAVWTMIRVFSDSRLSLNILLLPCKDHPAESRSRDFSSSALLWDGQV